MLNPIFPRQFDNVYRGSRIAIVLLAPVLLMKTLIGVNISGLNPWISTRFVIAKADGVPLDAFSPQAQEIVVFMSASWGLGLLLLCLLTLVALIRYRAMLPFAILLLAVEQVGRKILTAAILPPGDPFRFGSLINWGFSIALVIALILSLTPRRINAAS